MEVLYFLLNIRAHFSVIEYEHMHSIDACVHDFINLVLRPVEMMISQFFSNAISTVLLEHLCIIIKICEQRLPPHSIVIRAKY